MALAYFPNIYSAASCDTSRYFQVYADTLDGFACPNKMEIAGIFRIYPVIPTSREGWRRMLGTGYPAVSGLVAEAEFQAGCFPKWISPISQRPVASL